MTRPIYPPGWDRKSVADEKVLAAAAALAAARGVTRATLAAAAGLAPQTVALVVKRLRAAGRWPHPFPVHAPTKGKNLHGRSGVARPPVPVARRAGAPPPPMPPGRVHPVAPREDVDRGQAAEACAMLIEAWRRGPTRLRMAAESRLHR